MSNLPDIAGLAALSILEGLLLALNERKILPETEVLGILDDAAGAHYQIVSGDVATHQAVAKLIQSIIDGGNSVRHPG